MSKLRGENRSRDRDGLSQHLEAAGVAGCATSGSGFADTRATEKIPIVADDVAAAALRSVVLDGLVHSS